MSARKATIHKYVNATRILHVHIANGFEVDGREFANKHNLSNSFFTNLVNSGFMQKISSHEFCWNNCPINYQTIGNMLNSVGKHTINHNKRSVISINIPASNEVIEPVEEPEVVVEIETTPPVPSEPPEPYNVDRVSELEQRVASLEQLLIRRSIA